jgi:hypothetical protein
MKLADQWHAVQRRLPRDWEDVRLSVAPEQASDLPRVAAVLGSANAGRSGDRLVIHARRAGAASPAALDRLFTRLDEDRVWCTLEAGDAVAAAPSVEVADEPDVSVSVADSWDAALARLPAVRRSCRELRSSARRSTRRAIETPSASSSASGASGTAHRRE